MQYVIYILTNVSYFKVLWEPNVKIWLQENVFGHFKNLQSIIIGQGTIIFGLMVVSILLFFLVIAKKVAGSSTWVIALQNKIMWSAVFRSQI